MPTKRKQDPTGQARNRGRTTRRVRARLRKAEKAVLALFRALDRSVKRVAPIPNQTRAYEYQYDLELFSASVRRAIEAELETEGEAMPPFWFLLDDL